jgi:hypothetical protein
VCVVLGGGGVQQLGQRGWERRRRGRRRELGKHQRVELGGFGELGWEQRRELREHEQQRCVELDEQRVERGFQQQLRQ